MMWSDGMVKVSNDQRVRIGMVNFINTAPVYDVWKRTVQQPGWQVVEAPPSELNRLLYSGELDLGIVSSHEYASHPDRYRILAGLSISATGPVGSVFLFSRIAPEKLAGRLLLLSSQSQTSVSLVKIILEEFLHVFPRYETGGVLDSRDGMEEASGVLAIGDEALRLAGEGRYPYVLDLGEIWFENTGLPFVFAVWAVRRDFCEKFAPSVRAIRRELLRCTAQGRGELVEISGRVAGRIPMAADKCYEYLRDMEYDLGPLKQKALKLFIEYLVARGEGDRQALELAIFE